MSSSGKYQVVGSSSALYISRDYGQTWNLMFNTAAISFFAISSSGQYQTGVVTNGYIWTSDNFGQTWTQNTSAPSAAWNTVAVSGIGQYQTVGVSTTGSLYTSNDFGQTWTQNTSVSTNAKWSYVALSSTGQYQVAVIRDISASIGIYISTN
jgi:photosystem II stability/assembly factor-like uncharacterized protein